MNIFWQAAIPVMIGFVLHKLMAFSKRDRASRNTDAKASLWFWIKDNWVSTVFHATLMVAIILYTPDILDAVEGYKHTPAQVAEVVGALPLKLAYFVLGYLSAVPMTLMEKKLRAGKKRIAGFFRKK